MSESRLNSSGISKSTKMEEYAFLHTLRNFRHNVWLGFKKYFILFLVFAIVVSCSVFLYGRLTYVPRYESSVTFLAKPLISNQSNKMSDVFEYNNNIIMGSQLSVTFPHIFQTGILKEIIQSELGIKIDAVVTARSIAHTNYFKVTVNSDTPQNAKLFADALMKHYPKLSEAVLGDIRTEIKIPAKLPTAPCNSNDNLTSTLYALGMSVVLCAFFLCIYAANRKTICSKEDVRFILNQAYICEIPQVKEKSKSANKFKSVIRSKSFKESLLVLKNRILSTITDNELSVIGLVSTTNNEGKTTIAAGLAKTLASKTEAAIVVTFDRAASNNNGSKRKGASTVSLMKKLATYKTAAPVDGTKNLFDNVDLLILSPKLISDKQKMAEIFAALRENYAYTIVDVLPGDSHSESVSLLNCCDAYISVIRCDLVPTNKIKGALDYFSYGKARNLGVILNGVTSSYTSYGRYSNYGKYRKYAYGYNYYAYGRYGEDSSK